MKFPCPLLPRHTRLARLVVVGLALVGAVSFPSPGEELRPRSTSPYLLGWSRQRVRSQLGTPPCIRLVENGKVSDWSVSIFETMGRRREGQLGDDVYRRERNGRQWELVIRYVAKPEDADASPADVFSTPESGPRMIVTGYELSSVRPFSLPELAAHWPEMVPLLTERLLVGQPPGGKTLAGMGFGPSYHPSQYASGLATKPAPTSAPTTQSSAPIIIEACTLRGFPEMEEVVRLLPKGGAGREKACGVVLRMAAAFAPRTRDLTSARLSSLWVGPGNPVEMKNRASKLRIRLTEGQLRINESQKRLTTQKGEVQ